MRSSVSISGAATGEEEIASGFFGHRGQLGHVGLRLKPLALAVSGALSARWSPQLPGAGRACRPHRRWFAEPSTASRRFGGGSPAIALADVRVGAGLIRGAV